MSILAIHILLSQTMDPVDVVFGHVSFDTYLGISKV